MGNYPSCFEGLAPARPQASSDAKKIDVEGMRRRLGSDSDKMDCLFKAMQAIVSDYQVSETVLGKGASGSVVLAEREGKKYAVKSFRRGALSREQRAELQNEIETLMSLDHPNVVRLQGVYDTWREVNIVMEHMAGGEVYARVVAAGKYSEDRAANTLRQMCEAVSYMHSKGLVHRDLKLENFMYEGSDTDHVKLIDFGFAQKWDPKTKMDKKCGTLYYVAPEVLSGSYDEKCDCWSLGVLAHMLLTGRAPFYGSEDQVVQKIANGTIEPSEQFRALSSEAQSFINELLVLNPRQRLSAKDALAHEFLVGTHTDA